MRNSGVDCKQLFHFPLVSLRAGASVALAQRVHAAVEQHEMWVVFVCVFNSLGSSSGRGLARRLKVPFGQRRIQCWTGSAVGAARFGDATAAIQNFTQSFLCNIC